MTAGNEHLLKQIASLKEYIEEIEVLCGNFCTIKGIKVWATEENRNIKRRILAIAKEATGEDK